MKLYTITYLYIEDNILHDISIYTEQTLVKANEKFNELVMQIKDGYDKDEIPEYTINKDEKGFRTFEMYEPYEYLPTINQYVIVGETEV